MTPRLSVIVPTYNSGRTLGACLEAVQRSTFRDFELIVADCGSTDQTREIAWEHGARLLAVAGAPSRSAARNRGVAAAVGDVLVNIDSDVVIGPQTLGSTMDYLARHPDVDAVTGLLARDHPHSNFFSQYKNLYMHYVFSRLPERVTFLYGSFHAVRRECARSYGAIVPIADDLAVGQQLVAEGRRIVLVKDLEVIHLKRYTGWSLVRNDFRIPFEWAQIFVAYHGWRQIGRQGVGFAHARVEQLLSVLLVPGVVAIAALGGVHRWLALWGVGLAVGWGWLTLRFVRFLIRERGLRFGLCGWVVTFCDHLVMATGIGCGFIKAAAKRAQPPGA